MADTMFTHKLSEAQVLQLREAILGKGFVLGPLEYGHFSARKGKCVLQMYLSGKLVVAGKEAREFVEFNPSSRKFLEKRGSGMRRCAIRRCMLLTSGSMKVEKEIYLDRWWWRGCMWMRIRRNV